MLYYLKEYNQMLLQKHQTMNGMNGENIDEEFISAEGIEPDNSELKINFIQYVADVWGKQLKTISRIALHTGDCTDQVEVSFDLGGIPFAVLGVKGTGPCLKSAQADAAGNLLSAMELYLARESVELLRSRWSEATEQVDQLLEVLEEFDKYLNKKEYTLLRQMHPFTPSKLDKACLRKFRKVIREDIEIPQTLEYRGPRKIRKAAMTLSNFYDTLPDVPVWQPKGRDKYHFSYPDADVEKIENPDWQQHVSCCSLTYTARTIDQSDLATMVRSAAAGSGDVVLDSNRLDEWHELSQTKALGGHSTLSAWCLANNVPQDYERLLLGVHYSGSENIDRTVQKLMLEYNEEYRRVDEEIWKHFRTNVQNEEVYAEKMNVRQTLLEQFRTANLGQNILLFAVGSTVNGCGSMKSDLDLCLCLPELGTDGNYRMTGISTQPLYGLKELMMSHRLEHLVKEAEIIPAKVPIIKATLHPPFEKLDLDVNINNTPGIYNSHLFHYYSSLDSRFPCLTLLIKQWATNAGICDSFNGTFNSYSLMLMLIHYLQCGVQPAVFPNLQYMFPERFGSKPPLNRLELHKKIEGLPIRPVNVSTCVELLIGFFHYYARFNFGTHGISIRRAKTLRRDELATISKHKKIYIEEPFHGTHDNNAARCVYSKLDRITSAFESARSAFESGARELSRIGVQIDNI